MLNRSDLQFEESNSLGHNLKTFMKNNSDEGTNGSVSLDYKRTFKKGQELTGYLYYESGNERDESLNEQFMANGSLLKGLKNWEGEENRQFRAKFDYVHPFNGKMKLETGFQSRIDRSSDWLDVYWYSTPDDYEPSPGSPYYNESAFSRDIHSLYGMLSDARTKWGYQLGLRTEYTNRVIDYSGSTDAYRVERLDWFPTLHVSYNLPGSSQMIASYTRRIDRPRGFSLTPYIVYNDAYSVSSGNPALLPEYIDSYEIGYQKQLKKGFFSTELYFRQTNNKTERVQSVYQTNVIMNTFANIGTDYSLGLELMWNFNPVKWWALNLMGNFYNYRLDGEYNSRTIETESLNWNSRISNTFLLGKSTRLQADAMYNSPTVTAQGRREGFLFTNIAIRQDFMKNRLSATLGVRDVLNTAKFEFESEGPGFQSYRKFDMRSPVVSLTLSYRINNFRPQRQRSDNGGDGGGMMDMEGMM
jgi:outer membrane receptor protein involved in Fe transport